MLPVVTTGDDVVRRAAYAAILAGFALQSALNVAIWRRSDEFLRAVLAEATFAVFWIAQGALFLVAAAAKVGLVPMPTLWDGVTVLMAIYAVTSVVVGVRRGMG
ncbi:hypothetical protein WPS_05670 [Vulcanimicrobium alpinum]|uniref:Uncharacterized protein n=1 Tax=Vulcanimicrobium alpinum TaxID=3016050 RepID=A0AAN2C8T4_UNVUL|nr:hypothetical protein [Vulcanimicrobium alpinum]BDE05291.1 hypothetical protein WPS_05670 [Vulcanimicrobium alpinum]